MSSKAQRSTALKIKKFHVLGSEHCRYCKMIEGCIKMFLHDSSPAAYERFVSYYDRDDSNDMAAWSEEIAPATPASHRTIPRVVAEMSNGSLKFIGGVDDFVKKFGC